MCMDYTAIRPYLHQRIKKQQGPFDGVTGFKLSCTAQASSDTDNVEPSNLGTVLILVSSRVAHHIWSE
jgi:hypothetical protein